VPKKITKFPLKASVFAFALAGMSTAYAAGIGKLTVLSALGQPLRAEIELSATPDELNSVSAKLASQDQFRTQGMDYTAAVASLHLSVEKRANGQPYVRLSSDRPINEPFLDILVELTWASGRLTREYTFLLDPVDQPQPANSSVTSPNVAPVTQSAAPAVSSISNTQANTNTQAPAKSTKRSSTSRPVAPAQPAAASTPASTSSAAVAAPLSNGATIEVKRGDTLGKIAAGATPDGASLDQMLIALYNSNHDAFIGSNLNRLKTGKILNVPDRDTVLAVNADEAKKTVALHAQNFNAYRKQLADVAATGAPTDTAPTQSASGKITPKVDDKAPAPAAGQDKLEVSKSESGASGKAGGNAAKAAIEADRTAADKALKDAEARVAALEKNVADLKKLNDLQSQSLADAQKKAEAAKSTPAPAPVPTPAPAAAKQTDAAKPADTPKADTAKSATQISDAAKAADKPADTKPVAVTPPPPPKKKVVLPPPEPEPSFMDEYGSFLGLGAALVALIGGFFGYRAYQRRKAEESLDTPTISQLDDVTSTSSVFGNTGGQSVNTQDVSLASDFSKASLTDGEGATGVDPVAEAEVYMAYGRDAQAEEILLEALKAEPTRQAVHLKLLELYASRKSPKPFESVARELKQQTGGSGPNWDRAIMLGQSIDPENPLYGGLNVAAGDLGGTGTIVMQPGALAKLAAEAESNPPSVETEPAPAAEAERFDLDLGSDAPIASSEPEHADAVAPLDFDLDLGAAETSPTATPPLADIEIPPAHTEASAAAPLDIDFDLDLPTAPPDMTPATSAAAPAIDHGLDFDFNLDLPHAEEATAAESHAMAASAPKADFSGLDLDLETPSVTAAPTVIADEAFSPAEIAPVDEIDNPEVATKLELAQAYEEMGDKEGMRELLQEVLAEGNAAQQELARSKLALHGF